MYDIIIIGAGCAGLSCAVYAARFNLNVLVIGEQIGGLITTTHAVENWPGEKLISGMDLGKKLREHVEHLQVEIKPETVTQVKKKDKKFKIKTRDNEYEAKSILIATGTKRRELDVPGNKEFYSKGVSYCATCDGAFFKDKTVAVVGGSDSAAKEALYLADIAKKVFIIYRKEKIRSEPINTKRVDENKKIEIINKTNVTEIKGDKVMTHVILDKEYNGSKELKLDGLFIEIGQLPNVQLAKDLGIKLNSKDEIINGCDSRTNVKFVYAAGDVTEDPYKQAIVSAADGVKAAFSAFKDLN